MNNLEISAFIAAKKKSRSYIENELQGAQNVLAEMKAQKPVRWYHNFYYVFKRVLFVLIALLAFLMLVSTFTASDSFRKYFDSHYDAIVTEFLNDNFGSHTEILVSETSATDQKMVRSLATKQIRTDLRDKLVGRVFDYSMLILQIVLSIFVIVFCYLARLTRQLHLKNKKISEHYQINLNLVDLYSVVINEQKYEIDFLTSVTGRTE